VRGGRRALAQPPSLLPSQAQADSSTRRVGFDDPPSLRDLELAALDERAGGVAHKRHQRAEVLVAGECPRRLGGANRPAGRPAGEQGTNRLLGLRLGGRRRRGRGPLLCAQAPAAATAAKS
jgi:hypothetical protein